MSPLDQVVRELSTLRCVAFGERVQPFVVQGVLSRDVVFLVDLLGAATGESDAEALLWAALVLSSQRRGHSALPTADLARYLPPRVPRERDEEGPLPAEPLAWPREPGRLRGSRLLATRPPLLDLFDRPDGAVLQAPRMGQEEQWVAEALVALAEPVPLAEERFLRPSPACLQRGLDRFGRLADGREHPGCAALRALAERRLAVVTGGPGTGKTWSIKRVLAMLVEAAVEQDRPLVVRLAAPTGKAGVRMRQALGEDLDRLGVGDEVRQRLGELESSTLHRLLRLRPGAGTSRFGPDLPLPADVVVIDEASMIDLALMRQLVRAIGPATRLVLLGDRDQLPSVDVGSVLADLVARPFAHSLGLAPDPGPLGPVLTRFTINHRSGDAPTLAALVEALQDEADPARAAALPYLLGRQEHPDEEVPGRIRHVQPEAPGGRLSIAQLDGLVEPWRWEGDVPGYVAQLEALIRAGSRPLPQVAAATGELLAAFDRYRVLAVHRRGPLGVSGLARAIEARIEGSLKQAWLAEPRRGAWPRRAGKWLGQAVLVTLNSYELDLWNGDIGLVLPDPADGHALAVAFPADPRKHPGGFRFVALDRLPEHGGAFVMTVHKSQGSQYDHVAVVLASEASAIQSRELVYTGITRASQRVTWVGTEERLAEALRTPVVRGSLLQERVLGA